MGQPATTIRDLKDRSHLAWAAGSAVALVGLTGCGTPVAAPTPPATRSTPPATPSTPPATSVALRDGTYTGRVAQTPKGDVQVEIDVNSGRITDIRVPVYPTESANSQNINERAVPKLIQAGLAAQSADVDTVTGATYTSEGYRTSLQSAIDQATA